MYRYVVKNNCIIFIFYIICLIKCACLLTSIKIKLRTHTLDIHKTLMIHYVYPSNTHRYTKNFAFNPVPSDTSRLVLSWDTPLGTIIDSDDPVNTTYTVTVTGPIFNFVNTTTETSFEFIDELDQPCAMHEFFVSASNEAGQGMNVSLVEIIPICK